MKALLERQKGREDSAEAGGQDAGQAVRFAGRRIGRESREQRGHAGLFGSIQNPDRLPPVGPSEERSRRHNGAFRLADPGQQPVPRGRGGRLGLPFDGLPGQKIRRGRRAPDRERIGDLRKIGPPLARDPRDRRINRLKVSGHKQTRPQKKHGSEAENHESKNLHQPGIEAESGKTGKGRNAGRECPGVCRGSAWRKIVKHRDFEMGRHSIG